jgi:hypothetical protein
MVHISKCPDDLKNHLNGDNLHATQIRPRLHRRLRVFKTPIISPREPFGAFPTLQREKGRGRRDFLRV